MKVAISVPDDIFSSADALAKQKNWSRSKLYVKALRDFLTRRDVDVISEALNELYDSVKAVHHDVDHHDKAASALSKKRGLDVLRNTEW